jgi:hypothetical protein
MNVLEFIEFARKNGGGSFNFITGKVNPTTGYMVALKDFQQVSCSLDAELVKMFTREHAEFLIRDDVYLGLWLSNGLWYYDVSINVEGLGKAVQVGLENNQLAIWDCKNNDEIKL